MTTKRESILAYVATTLAGVSGVSGRIYRSRPEPVRREETPSIVVEPMQDVSEYNLLDFIDWTMQFKLTIFTRGAVPDQLADPIVQAAYGLLMADRNLGGLVFDIIPSGIYNQINDGDQAAGTTEMLFTCKYRTASATLT